MLTTLRRRWPAARVVVRPVRVQGAGAAADIAAGIADLNRLGGVDVLLVGRGGGSLEDLWAFNEEVVARAIVASRVPVVSGVGHEIDVTIADLVADRRAATPTAAAAAAVPERERLRAPGRGLARRPGRGARCAGLVAHARAAASLRDALAEPAAPRAIISRCGWTTCRPCAAARARAARRLGAPARLATLARRLAAAGPGAALGRVAAAPGGTARTAAPRGRRRGSARRRRSVERADAGT